MRDTGDHYTRLAIVFHWTVALLVLGQISSGIYMTKFATPMSQAQFEWFQMHKSFGISILLITILRLLWRQLNPPPDLPITLLQWERIAAGISHFLLYALTILTPLAGWATVSVSPLDIDTELFGLIPWPHMEFLKDLGEPETLEELFGEIHEILAFSLVGVFVLHAGAALRHHFILRDAVLHRMIPFIPPRGED